MIYPDKKDIGKSVLYIPVRVGGEFNGSEEGKATRREDLYRL